MGMLLTYAISDYTPLINFLMKIAKCSCRDEENSCFAAKDQSSLVNYCNGLNSMSSVAKNSLRRNLAGRVKKKQRISSHTPGCCF